MAPTILIVGATGNTGQAVVETLSKSLDNVKALSGHNIYALTRSSKGAAAQRLAKLPGVSVVEYDWPEITEEWLREHEVVRAFIASHNEPNQFAEESTFHLAALKAGVKYVVRISTTAANVRPDCDAYYPRSHWAIEAMLSSPEFSKYQWTSLQPNVFTPLYLSSAVQLVKQYRETGTQNTLKLIADEDSPVGIIHPDEVGIFAAHLLSQEDPSVHSGAKYVLNGPEDISGRQIVDMVEKHIGTQVKDVIFKDLSFLEPMAAASPWSKNVIMSIRYAPVTAWNGLCTASTTSPEVLKIAAPRLTPTQCFETMLG
ncbi:NmrA-like family protein [Thozetella sp. PMI_491]|nr:NmrA-like family protein [Thozetella sp. PMI_491]